MVRHWSSRLVVLQSERSDHCVAIGRTNAVLVTSPVVSILIVIVLSSWGLHVLTTECLREVTCLFLQMSCPLGLSSIAILASSCRCHVSIFRRLQLGYCSTAVALIVIR